MNKEKIKDILSRSFATVDIDRVTRKRVETDFVTGYHFLAEYEIDEIIDQIMSIK